MQLNLVVADLYLDPAELKPDPGAGLQRLPGLEEALRRGRAARVAGDWRTSLARLAGRPDLAAVPPAQVAALALGSPVPQNPWFASPVHFTAGLDHLRLHPAGLLWLERAELAELEAGFAQTFAGAGLVLQPLFGGFVLTGLAARDAQTHDPANFLGADVGRAPATGPQAAELRRLGSEIEMWLHENSTNRARERRGKLPISALWIWGGGSAATLPAGLRGKSLALPHGYADNAYAAGLWHASGGELQPLPLQLDALWRDPDLGKAGQQLVVTLSAAATGPRDAPLARIDAHWIAPALQGLRAGQLSELVLFVAGLQVRLSDLDRLRFWRRRQPWWEHFAA